VVSGVVFSQDTEQLRRAVKTLGVKGHCFSLIWPEMALTIDAQSTERRDVLMQCFQTIVNELQSRAEDVGAEDGLQLQMGAALSSPSNTSTSGAGARRSGALKHMNGPGSPKDSLNLVGGGIASPLMLEISRAHHHILKRQENAADEKAALRWVHGFKITDRFLMDRRQESMLWCWETWADFVRRTNEPKMVQDRKQWHLHAQASSAQDLHAWYHSVFCQEVYRLQGPFWYKPAKLSVYRCTNTPVGGAPLTPMEKAILASVMCTKGTTYVDVAVQMYTVQAVLSEEEFQLYQRLTSGEVELVKHAMSSKPAKKKFRLSFVNGALYLTWGDKNGYKGIGLHEVLTIVGGNKSDDSSDLYLSLLLPDRSLDISFEEVAQRQTWQSFLGTLVKKERGEAYNIRDDLKYTSTPSNA